MNGFFNIMYSRTRTNKNHQTIAPQQAQWMSGVVTYLKEVSRTFFRLLHAPCIECESLIQKYKLVNNWQWSVAKCFVVKTQTRLETWKVVLSIIIRNTNLVIIEDVDMGKFERGAYLWRRDYYTALKAAAVEGLVRGKSCAARAHSQHNSSVNH